MRDVDQPEIGIGIIASGYMGRTYAECVARYCTGARLVAVAGGSRAPGLAADYGIDAEPSVEALLQRDDIDAVIITSPQSAHARADRPGGAAMANTCWWKSRWPRPPPSASA